MVQWHAFVWGVSFVKGSLVSLFWYTRSISDLFLTSCTVDSTKEYFVQIIKLIRNDAYKRKHWEKTVKIINLGMGAESQPGEKFTLKIPPKGKRVC